MSIIQTKLGSGALVGWWDFRAGHLDDLSGQGHDGTFVGSPVLSRRGIRLDGVADAVSVGATGETVQSVVIMLNPSTTTEDIADFDGGTHTLEVNAGTVTATGWAAPSIYVDGLLGSTLVANREQVIAVTTGTGFTASALVLGKETSFLDGTIAAVLIFTEALTAQEIAQLTSELRDQVWPQSTHGQSILGGLLDCSESGLVGCWSGSGRADGWFDHSITRNDAVRSGDVVSARGLVGGYMQFGGSNDYLQVPHSAAYAMSDDFTIAALVRTGANPSRFLYHYDPVTQDGYYLGTKAGGIPQMAVLVGGSADVAEGAAAATDAWQLIIGRRSGAGAIELFVDGVVQATTGTLAGAIDSTDPVYLGIDRGLASDLDGDMQMVALWDRALLNDEIRVMSEKIASVVQYKTDWGTRVSDGSVTSGFLEDTGWEVGSGTWKVTTDTIDGVRCKVIECIADGALDLDLRRFMTDEEAVKGTLRWWWARANTSFLNFALADAPGNLVAGTDYYRVTSLSSGAAAPNSVGLWKNVSTVTTSLFQTAGGDMLPGAWHEAKWTIRYDGQHAVYLDDTLLTADTGSNPVVDTSLSALRYLKIQGDAGDKVAIADDKGGHSIDKQLGVV